MRKKGWSFWPEIAQEATICPVEKCTGTNGNMQISPMENFPTTLIKKFPQVAYWGHFRSGKWHRGRPLLTMHSSPDPNCASIYLWNELPTGASTGTLMTQSPLGSSVGCVMYESSLSESVSNIPTICLCFLRRSFHHKGEAMLLVETDDPSLNVIIALGKDHWLHSSLQLFSGSPSPLLKATWSYYEVTRCCPQLGGHLLTKTLSINPLLPRHGGWARALCSKTPCTSPEHPSFYHFHVTAEDIKPAAGKLLSSH